MIKAEYLRLAVFAPVIAATLMACTTVTLKGDENEPIVVNLNVKIDQEVRVKLDREIEDLISQNPDIF
ncbi:YnbE family lipoprotein [Hyphococcus lacteus]|uniref:YnbE family lipoprotein n=1 Tax=Hyphococcus lacteus TaxID=3143536 RepID=A0ABV3Z096_9PROT